MLDARRPDREGLQPVVLKQAATRPETRSDGELALFFDASLDIMTIYDAQHGYVRVSQSFTDTLGYAREDVIGRSYHEFIDPTDHAITGARVERRVQQGDVSYFALQFRHADGHYRDIEWRSRAIGDRIYSVGRDVTERIAASVEMAAARLAAEAAN